MQIRALANDQFTLYLGEGSLDADYPKLIGGIRRISCAEEKESQRSLHVIKFDLPFDKHCYINLIPLLSAKECPLSEAPRSLSTHVALVEKCPNRTDHRYFVRGAEIKDYRLHLSINHSFPVTGFRLEYEKIIDCRQKALAAELFAIEDHSNRDCTCLRKEERESVIAFDLMEFYQGADRIELWGPPDTQFSGEMSTEIAIDHKKIAIDPFKRKIKGSDLRSAS